MVGQQLGDMKRVTVDIGKNYRMDVKLMKKLIYISLLVGLLAGCRSTFSINMDTYKKPILKEKMPTNKFLNMYRYSVDDYPIEISYNGEVCYIAHMIQNDEMSLLAAIVSKSKKPFPKDELSILKTITSKKESFTPRAVMSNYLLIFQVKKLIYCKPIKFGRIKWNNDRHLVIENRTKTIVVKVDEKGRVVRKKE